MKWDPSISLHTGFKLCTPDCNKTHASYKPGGGLRVYGLPPIEAQSYLQCFLSFLIPRKKPITGLTKVCNSSASIYMHLTCAMCQKWKSWGKSSYSIPSSLSFLITQRTMQAIASAVVNRLRCLALLWGVAFRDAARHSIIKTVYVKCFSVRF